MKWLLAFLFCTSAHAYVDKLYLDNCYSIDYNGSIYIFKVTKILGEHTYEIKTTNKGDGVLLMRNTMLVDKLNCEDLTFQE